jgi:hypothetical protein
VANFTRFHVDQFRRDYRYTTFPLYLRDNFAPDLLPSSMTCDSQANSRGTHLLPPVYTQAVTSRSPVIHPGKRRSFCCRRSESSRQSTIDRATISRRHNRIRVLHLRRRLPILSWCCSLRRALHVQQLRRRRKAIFIERRHIRSLLNLTGEIPGNSLASTALYTSCEGAPRNVWLMLLSNILTGALSLI